MFHTVMEMQRWAAFLAVVLLMAAAPAWAGKAKDVDLELVLAVDVSGSIDGAGAADDSGS